MTFLLQLRDAAKGCSNVEHRNRLKWCADHIATAIDDLHGSPTEENLRFLNGLWIYGHCALKGMPPEGTPAPLAPGEDWILPENITAALLQKDA